MQALQIAVVVLKAEHSEGMVRQTKPKAYCPEGHFTTIKVQVPSELSC